LSITADDLLGLITPYLTPALVSPEALAGVRREAKLWPLAGHLGFECRLNSDARAVDFGLCTESSLRERARLVRALLSGERLGAGPQSERLRELLSRLAGSDPSLTRDVRNICFEVDLDAGHLPHPPPGLFVGLWHPGTEHLEDAPAAPARDPVPVIRAVAGALFAGGLGERTDRRVADVAASLGGGAFVANFGLLPGRGEGVIRLNVCGLSSAAECRGWLRERGWRGSDELLGRAFDLFEDLDPQVYLNLDAGEEILPRVGLEIFFQQQPKHSPRLQAFLERLLARGLCSPREQEALTEWPGASREEPGGPAWPEPFSTLSGLFSRHATSYVVRSLNHLKLLVGPEGTLQAKAYLSFGHRWVTGREGRDESRDGNR
jgi:hypothetical protein